MVEMGNAHASGDIDRIRPNESERSFMNYCCNFNVTQARE